jgi:hypothetical protein
MALINNWVELRSDAFKIAKLGRRPLPSRIDSIGAWLPALVSGAVLSRESDCEP